MQQEEGDAEDVRGVQAVLLICLAVLVGAALTGVVIIIEQTRNYTASYEEDNYNTTVYQGTMFAADLCVAADQVDLAGFEPDADLHAAGLFDLEADSVCADISFMIGCILQALQRS